MPETCQIPVDQRVNQKEPRKSGQEVKKITHGHKFQNLIVDEKIWPEFEKISEEGKIWIARAIVSILIVDKQLVNEEKGFFKDAIMMIEIDQIRVELIESIKKREIVELGELTTDREYAGHFYFLLAMVVAADGKVKNSEVNLLNSICRKLGFPYRNRETSFAMGD